IRIQAKLDNTISLAENRRDTCSARDLRGFVLRKGSALTCESMEMVRLSIEEGASLTVASASNCAVNGPGIFIVSRQVRGLDLLPPDTLLLAHQHAQLHGLRGSTRLAKAQNALIAGTPSRRARRRGRDCDDDGLMISDITSRTEDDLEGVSLTNARFP